MKTMLAESTAHETTEGYPELERIIASKIEAVDKNLFTTDADELFELFLSKLPDERRQHYTCHCCRRFFERYAGLAVITEDGSQNSAIFDVPVPVFFEAATSAVAAKVSKSRINGVFYTADAVWGTPRTKDWTHISGVFQNPYKARVLDAGQAMAAKKEDYGMLQRGLAEFSLEIVQQAVRVLKAGAVDRSEKTLGVAEWLLALKTATGEEKNRQRKENRVWLAVATAPPGFCHVRTTMISTLLEDLESGKAFDEVAARWKAKMHPLQYQRPTTVKAGNIEQAEKLVDKLGIREAFERRYARLDELKTFWTAKALAKADERKGGVFDHLKPSVAKTAPAIELPIKTMTCEKFWNAVVPTAIEMAVLAPVAGPYVSFVTAVNADAPPILQWDTEPRNPISWYYQHPAGRATDFNVSPGAWVKVLAMTGNPAHWHHPEKSKHYPPFVSFILEGCKHLRNDGGGCFFPECLKSELHEVRSVMEAHARTYKIGGIDEGAFGLSIQKGGSETPVQVRVRDASGIANYKIDRWE